MEEEADAPPADPNPHAEEIARLHADFRHRLMLVDLRTEAIKACMIDLDGLKLMDVSALRLDNNDRVVDGATLMDEFRRRKPWLFGSGPSPAPAVAPLVAPTVARPVAPDSQPARTKSAMDMSDAEYAAARAAVTRQRH